MEKEVKEKSNKKKIIIISIIIVAVLVLGIASIFAIKMIKEKIEYDKIIIDVKEEKVELNYGDTLDVNELLTKYEGGEIEIENNIDFYKTGEYKVIYTVTSENGIEKKKEIIVNILDNDPPTLTLDADSVNVKLNEEIDLLSGVTAEDNYDKEIASKITVTGEVDTSKEGTYEIKYDVKDSSNNSAETKVRTYTVKKEPTLQTGKTYEWTNAQGGCRIELKENNQFMESTWANQGGASDSKGTYKIEGNKLTLNATQKFELMGWEPSNFTSIFTITDDNQFTDSEGRVYKMK
ncbi:MAG: DUF5011 domain-containing protein [Clostridia bacterium]|nr:DUF5011 domain-containing protein [Clostridia bacterium]